MIRRIRLVQGLVAETVAEIVDLACFTDEYPLEITGVELNTRLCGDHLHDTTAMRFHYLSDEP